MHDISQLPAQCRVPQITRRASHTVYCICSILHIMYSLCRTTLPRHLPSYPGKEFETPHQAEGLQEALLATASRKTRVDKEYGCDLRSGSSGSPMQDSQGGTMTEALILAFQRINSAITRLSNYICNSKTKYDTCRQLPFSTVWTVKIHTWENLTVLCLFYREPKKSGSSVVSIPLGIEPRAYLAIRIAPKYHATEMTDSACFTSCK
jgi:hypothetical protein